MLEELKILIKQSKSLDEKSKETYLKLIDFLPEEQVSKFFQILKKEHNQISALEEEKRTKKSEETKKCILDITEIFKQGKKESIAKEEADEQKQGDEILEQLNNN